MVSRNTSQTTTRQHRHSIPSTPTGTWIMLTVVTNRHVASGSSGVQLATWNGSDFSASVSAISSGPDLALLGTAPNASSATLAPVDPGSGTSVWVTGYPEGNQLTRCRDR